MSPAVPGIPPDRIPEDIQHQSGDPGEFILGVRNDANVVVTDTDGDYSQISVDDRGNVRVVGTVSVENFPAEVEISNDVGNPIPIDDAGGSITVDDGGLSLTIDGTVSVDNFPASVEVSNDVGNPIPVDDAGGSLTVDSLSQHPEDSPHASGDIGDLVLGVRNDGAVVITDADGDYSPIATDSAGRVGITDLGGSISIDDNGGTITVDGTVSVSNFPASVEVSNDVGNPLPVDDAGGSLTVDSLSQKIEDSPHVSGTTGDFVLAVRNDAAAALTDTNGDYSPIATDSAGRVGIADLGGSLSVDDNGSSLTVDGVFQHAEDDPHASGDIGVFALAVRNDVTGNVLTSANGDYSPIAVDSAGRIRLAAAKNEDDPHVSGDTGIPAWGVRNDTDATMTSADGDYSPMATSAAGHLKTDTTIVSTAATSGGLAIYKNLDVNATGQLIKGAPGQIYTIIANNQANATRFLKLYNKATAPIVGTDIPIATILLDGRNAGGATSLQIDISAGLAFSLGIGIAATTGIADANTGNPGANDVVVTTGFK